MIEPRRHKGTEKILTIRTQKSLCLVSLWYKPKMTTFEPLSAETERIGGVVVNAAFQVHSALGPGLLESVYEACLCHELRQRGIPFQSQVVLPVVYDGVRIDAGLRLDLLVAEHVIVELKAVEKMLPLFDAQLLT